MFCPREANPADEKMMTADFSEITKSVQQTTIISDRQHKSSLESLFPQFVMYYDICVFMFQIKTF
jgi:hypothetical protein